MKPKTQILVLVALLAVLAIVAVVVLSRGMKTADAGPVSSASTAIAAGAPAAKNDSLPSREEMTFLAEWFGQALKERAADQCSPRKGLGMPQAPIIAITPSPALVPAPDTAAKAGEIAVEAPRETLRLQGILTRGRTPLAVIQNESYRLNDTVADGYYTVSAIAESSVKLRARDGHEVVLDLLQ